LISDSLFFLKVAYFNNTSGLDFWTQTKDGLKPVLDKNGTYSTVNRFIDINNFTTYIIESLKKYVQFAFNERITQIIDSHDKSKPLFLYYAAQNPHKDDDYNVANVLIFSR